MKIKPNFIAVLVNLEHPSHPTTIRIGSELHRLMMDSFRIWVEMHGGKFITNRNNDYVFMDFIHPCPELKALTAVVSQYLQTTDCTYTVEDVSAKEKLIYVFKVLNMYELRFDKIKEK